MTHDELIARVRAHGGMDERGARAALDAVVAVLAEGLGRPEAERLADALPRPLGERARAGSFLGALDGEELRRRVAERERVPLPMALEHLGAVGRALAAALPADVLDALSAAVPAVREVLIADEPPGERILLRRSTLAEGRPGSRRPLSESAPPLAQSESVVASENPHGPAKLSSSPGLTQEREHETLAEGRPGADRPISGR